MNYRDAMEFLESTKKYGSVPGLDSIRNLMNELGNVQDKLNIIHIAGTNGKGSVGAMLSSVYTCEGWKTGRFSTPDVFSYEEEFMINNCPVSKARLTEIFRKVKDACGRLVEKGLPHPTRFEVETAAAFLWMYEEQVDVAIIETGMGGALDATNLVCAPLASVFTSVGMDHEAYLGDTLEKIAENKAGIIKKGCPAVSSWQDQRVAKILKRKAEEMKADFFIASEESVRDISGKEEGISFSYKQYKNIRLSLKGRFQIQNGTCALEVIQCLQKKLPVKEENVQKGFSCVRWPGRFEKVSASPDVYIDGAHNPDAAGKLRETLNADFTDRRIVYIMGVLKDKDYEKIADIMFQKEDPVITVTPDHARALNGGILMDVLRHKGCCARCAISVEEALDLAYDVCGPEDMILAFGSLSYLGELKAACLEYSGGAQDGR